MILIPAIDLKQGRCVRLRQGRMDDATVFSDDPAAMARQWREQGAQRLHVVDLDGAFDGKPKNADSIQVITAALPDFTVQVGGGIRNTETIQAYLDAGVDYVIIGSQAVRDPDFVKQACRQFPGTVIVGIDVRDGKVAVEGWSQLSTVDAIGFAKQFADDGVQAIVYTDISKDGMMQGVNVAATLNMARSIPIPVIASGGVSTMADIEALYHVCAEGIMGAIIGRALYEGSIDLPGALDWVTQQAG